MRVRGWFGCFEEKQRMELFFRSSPSPFRFVREGKVNFFIFFHLAVFLLLFRACACTQAAKRETRRERTCFCLALFSLCCRRSRRQLASNEERRREGTTKLTSESKSIDLFSPRFSRSSWPKSSFFLVCSPLHCRLIACVKEKCERVRERARNVVKRTKLFCFSFAFLRRRIGEGFAFLLKKRKKAWKQRFSLPDLVRARPVLSFREEPSPKKGNSKARNLASSSDATEKEKTLSPSFFSSSSFPVLSSSLSASDPLGRARTVNSDPIGHRGNPKNEGKRCRERARECTNDERSTTTMPRRETKQRRNLLLLLCRC